MLPWVEYMKGATWCDWPCPGPTLQHGFDPWTHLDCYKYLLRAHPTSHVSLSLSPPLHLLFSLSTSECVFLSWSVCSPSLVHTCFCPSLFLCSPAWVSPSLCMCLWCFSSPLSLLLSLPSYSLLLLFLPPSESLPTWATPPAVWGPTQPSHSAHILNSHLLSLPSPFLAAGHSKQNVRKQKLMSFFKRG